MLLPTLLPVAVTLRTTGTPQLARIRVRLGHTIAGQLLVAAAVITVGRAP